MCEWIFRVGVQSVCSLAQIADYELAAHHKQPAVAPVVLVVGRECANSTISMTEFLSLAALTERASDSLG